MPDEIGGLKIELLDRFNAKLDDVYNKLVLLDTELQKFENKELSIVLSKESLSTARALDQLARAFVRFRDADATSLQSAGASISTFVNEVNGALNKLSSGDTSVISSVFKPFLIDLSGIFAIALDISPARIKGLREVITEVKDIFKLTSEVIDSVSGTSEVGVRFVKKIINDALIPSLQTIKDLLGITKDITAGRIAALKDILATLGVVFRQVQDLSNSVGRIVSGAGPGDYIKFVVLLRAGILPMLRISVDLVNAAANVTPQRLDKLIPVFTSLSNTFEVIKKFSIEITNLASSASTTDILKLIPYIYVITNIVKAFERFADVGSSGAQALTAIPAVFESLIKVVELFARLQSEFNRFILVFDLVAIARAWLIFTVALNNVLDASIRIIRSTRGIEPQSLTAVANILKAMADLVLIFARLQGEFNRFFIGADLLSIARAWILFGIIVNAIGDSVKRIVRSASGVAPEALQGLGLILKSLGEVIREFIGLQNEFNRGSIISDLASAARAWILFGIVGSAIGDTIKRIVRALEGANPSSVTAVADVLRSLRFVFRYFIELQQSFAGANFFTTAGEFLRALVAFNLIGNAIGNLVKGLLRNVVGVNPQTLTAVGSILNAFGKVFKEILALRFVTEGEGLFSVIKTLIKTLIIFRGLTGGIVGALKNIGRVAKQFNPESLRAATDAIEGLFRIAKLFQEDLKLSSDSVQVFKDLGDALNKFKIKRDVVRSFEVLSKLSSLSGDLTSPLKNLKDLLQVLASSDINQIKNVSFGNLANELDRLLRVLKRASSNELKTLITALSGTNSVTSSLENVSNAIRPVTTRFEGLGVTITRSVRNAVLQVRLFEVALNAIGFTANTVFNAFKQFNTVSLFTGAINGAAELGNKIREVGDDIRDIGENIRDFGTNLIENFGIGRLFETEAFTDAVDFDRIGTQLEVFGGLTEEARIKAEDFANQIGRDYPLSANDALAATLDLVKAGQSLEAVEFILPSAADLAALSDSGDIGRSTETLIAAASAFTTFSTATGEAVGGFENIAVAANIISGAADISTASVESLSDGLANVGPAASAFGLSLEETAAILAIFDQNAIRGAEGGTALRSLLNALGSDKSINTLRQLGISLFDADTGNRRPLNEVINDIGAALDGLPDAQRANILQNLADTYGRQGLLVLLGEGEDAISDTVAAINEIAPASDRAAQLLDNFAGDVTQLTGSFQTLLTAALLPTLERFFRPFVQILRAVVDGLLSLDRSVLAFISSAVVLASIGATLLGGFLAFVGVVLQVGGALFIVVGTLVNFGLVISSIVVGIAAFTAGLATILVVGTAILPVVLGITAVFETLFRIFQEDAGGAATAARTFFTSVTDSLRVFVDFFGAFANIIRLNLGLFTGSGRSGLEGFGQTIALFFRGITQPFTEFVQSGIGSKIQQLTNVFNAIAQVTTLGRQLGQIRTQIAGGLLDSTALDQLTSQATAIEEQISSILFNLVSTTPLVRDAMTRLFGPIRNIADRDAAIGLFVDEFNRNIRRLADSVNQDLIAPFQNFANTVLQGGGFGVAFQTLVTEFDQGAAQFIQVALNFAELLFGPSSVLSGLQTSFAESFTSGISSFIGLIVTTLTEAAIANQDTLRNVVTTLFSFLFAPLKSARFFANILGIEPLVGLIDFFSGILEGLVGGLFDTFINVLEGQSLGDALVDAFGDGIAPLVDFADALSEAVGFVVTIITNFFSSLAGSDETALDGFIAFVNERIEGITRLVRALSDNILEPLSRGDLAGAVGNLGSFLIAKLTSSVNALKQFILSLDIDLGSLLAGLGNTIVTALAGGLRLVENISGFDFTSVITFLEGLLETDAAGVVNAFAGVASTIIGLLGTAITTAFTTLGDFIGIDTAAIQSTLETSFGGVISALQNLFLDTEEGDSIFTNIQQTLDNIITPLQQLFAVFRDNADIDTASSGGAFQAVADFIGRLIGFGVDTVSDIINAIDQLFETLSELDSGQLANLGTIFGSLAIAFIVLSGGLTTFAASVTALTASLAPALLPIATFITAAFLIKSAIAEFDEILDIVEAFANADLASIFTETVDAILAIITDMAATVAGLLGFEEAEQRIRDFGAFARREFERLANVVADQSTLIAARTSAGIGAITQNAGAQAFLAVEKAFNENAGTLDIARVFGAGQGGLVAQNELDAFARLNADVFIGSFSDQLITASSDGGGFAAFAGASGDAFRNALQTAISSGLTPEFLEAILASGDFSLLSATIAEGVQFGPEAGLAIIQSLQSALTSGLITEEEFKIQLGNIAYEATDQVVIDAANNLIANTQAVVDEMPPAESTVPVTPQPEIQEVQDIAAVQDDIQSTLNAALAAGSVEPVNVDVPVNPNPTEPTEGTALGFSETAPEDAAQLNRDVELLRTNLGLLLLDIQTLSPDLNGMVTSFVEFDTTLQSFDTTVITTTTNFNALLVNGAIYLGAFGLSVQLWLVLVAIPALIQLNDLALQIGLRFVASFAAATVAMATFGTTALNIFNSIASGAGTAISSVNNLTTSLVAADAAARSVASNVNASGAGGTSADNADGGRAQGGTVLDGGLYKITEGGSEVLEENGVRYLLSSGRGRVLRMDQLPDFSSSRQTGMIPTPTSTQRQVVNNTSTVEVVVEGSTIALTVNGSNMNADQLVRQALPQIQAELDKRDKRVADLLRTRGK